MAWTPEKVEESLALIDRLGGVESVDANGSYLYIRTKAWTLFHRDSMLPLPRVVIRIDRFGRSTDVYMKYVMPASKFLHWHPTINQKILVVGGFRKVCIGDYTTDLAHAQADSPYMTAITLLAMLQGIKMAPEDNVAEDWLIAFMFIVIAAVPTMIIATAIFTG